MRRKEAIRITSWNGGCPTRPSSQPSIVPALMPSDLPQPGARVARRFAALLQESGKSCLLESLARHLRINRYRRIRPDLRHSDSRESTEANER